MDKHRKCFTFIWKIKNFSFSFNHSSYFDSPAFIVHEICGSKYQLVLYPKSKSFEDYVVCVLFKIPDSKKQELDFELSFLTSDESVLFSETYLKKAFDLPIEHSSKLKVKRNDVFFQKKHLFIPEDTLTIRCRMWNIQEPISETVKCHAETRINTECRLLEGTIKNFSSLKTNSLNKFCISSVEKQFPISSLNLIISVDGKLNIEVYPTIFHSLAVYKFNVFIIDAYGNKVKSCEEKILEEAPFIIPLAFSLEYLIENNELYLRNNDLTLQCKVVFPKDHKIGNPLENVNDMIYEYGCEDVQLAITDEKNANSSSFEEYHTESLTTLTDDLISFFNESILYDTKLKTSTETFPAHTIVLSARSSVFKSMFMNDMKEKMNGCVNIEDLDANTVSQMLLFMYKDTIDNLDYESAKSLYFAADKYNIVSLRHRCSNFLKQNLQYSNCIDVLLLTDRHNDLELKKCVQDSIEDYDEAVFSSEQWKNLEESHPQLTIEILLSLYKKNKKS